MTCWFSISCFPGETAMKFSPSCAVALTAFANEGDARAALTAGFQVHIPKPVDLHTLTLVIANLLLANASSCP